MGRKGSSGSPSGSRDAVSEGKKERVRFYLLFWYLVGLEKSKDAECLRIYSLGLDAKGKQRVRDYGLLEFWPEGSRLRINNKTDKDSAPHKEDVIRSQIDDAMHFKHKWHNSQHFVYWCRYETPQVHFRIKQVRYRLSLSLFAGLSQQLPVINNYGLSRTFRVRLLTIR